MKLTTLLSATFLVAVTSASQAAPTNFEARFTSDNQITSMEAFDGTTTSTVDLSSTSNLDEWRISDVLETNFDPTKTWTFTFNTSNYSNSANPAGFIADITFNGNSYNTGTANWQVNKDDGLFQSAVLNAYNYNGNSQWQDKSLFTGKWIGFDSSVNQPGSTDFSYQLTVSAVPEASTYALMLSGLGIVGMMVRRRKKLDVAA